MPRSTICYAIKNFTDRHEPGGFYYFHVYTSAFPVSMCDPNEESKICKILVTELTEDIPEKAYWAWWHAEDQEFTWVYAVSGLLDMVFPYGMKAAQERGQGEVYRVSIEEQGFFTYKEAKAKEWRP